LTQVSPRRTLEVNFWDFSSSAMSTPDQPVLRSGRNTQRLTISRPNFRYGGGPRRQLLQGYLIERNSRCLIDIVELLAVCIHIEETGQEFTFFQPFGGGAGSRAAIGRVVTCVELAEQDPTAVMQHYRQYISRRVVCG